VRSVTSSLSAALCISSLSVQSKVLEEELLDGTHILISVELNDGISQIPTHALVDCGASPITEQNRLPMTQLFFSLNEFRPWWNIINETRRSR